MIFLKCEFTRKLHYETYQCSEGLYNSVNIFQLAIHYAQLNRDFSVRLQVIDILRISILQSIFWNKYPVSSFDSSEVPSNYMPFKAEFSHALHPSVMANYMQKSDSSCQHLTRQSEYIKHTSG